jgi:hypothetical protein
MVDSGGHRWSMVATDDAAIVPHAVPAWRRPKTSGSMAAT